MEDYEWFNEIVTEYGSLEKYIIERDKSGADPLLYGYKPFEYLLSKNYLQKPDFIRTNLQGGIMDGHYQITEDGKLEGVDAAQGLYSGKEGIHEPSKLLSLKVCDNGWTLGKFAKYRIKFS